MKKRIFLSPPDIGREERRAVAAAFDSGYVAPCGPMVDEFERETAKLAGRRFAVAVSSGTAAIDLAMAEYGVDSSWTVISPALTFIATVGPAWHRGAKLEFVDSDETGNMDCSLLEEALAARRRTKHLMVVGVDLYGRCCDYGRIAKLCRRAGAVFLCDSAEAVGARFKGLPSGSAGEIAVYSFNGNKIVTTSGGGVLLTDDHGVAERARKRAQQSREAVAWYEHREVGYNYRMSNILAALGLAQLRRLPEILEKRAANRRFYGRILPLLDNTDGNGWLSVAVMGSRRERDALMRTLAADDIESRPVWKPLHLQPVFAGCRSWGGEVAETLFDLGVCLPSGTSLSAADRSRIEKAIRASL